MKTIKLNNGLEMPIFRVWRLPGKSPASILKSVIDAIGTWLSSFEGMGLND